MANAEKTESVEELKKRFAGVQTAVLTEQGAPPLTMRWSPDGRRGRYSAGEARLVIRDEDVRWSRFGEQPRTCVPR